MHEQKIDEIDAQILEALVDRTREFFGAQIFVRHFCRQKDLLACNIRRAYSFAYATFSAVFPGRVDMPIAEPERVGDDLAAIAQLRSPESNGRHLGTVGGQFWNGRRSHAWMPAK